MLNFNNYLLVKRFAGSLSNNLLLRFSLAGMLLFMAYTSTAQQNLIKFNRKTSRSGLSQSFIRCITSDKNGFLWIGTNDGLNRYDGYTFKVYLNDPKNKKSISANTIISNYVDSKGILYVATENGGLFPKNFTRWF